MSKVEYIDSSTKEEPLGSGKIEYIEECSDKSEYTDTDSGKIEVEDISNPSPSGKSLVELANYCGKCGHKFVGEEEFFCPICGMKRETL